MSSQFERYLKRLTSSLNALEKKQLPFALSVALNNTANKSKRFAQRELKRTLDRPTPFTANGIAVVRSNKKTLAARVLIKDIQASYLQHLVKGGKSLNVKVKPVNIKLNKYGNIPSMKGGKKINALRNRKDTFIGKVHGVSGLWQRIQKGRKLALLIRFVDGQRYRKQYPFHEIVLQEAGREIGPEFRKAMNSAVATAFK